MLEPPSEYEEILPEALDLILVPGLAFDKSGYRLGYGGGFYDRILGRGLGLKIGICLRENLWESLPVEPHDERVDYIITEEGVVQCLKDGKNFYQEI